MIIIVVSAIVYGISTETDHALKTSYQEKLLLLANTTASHIDGDSFRNIQPGDENSPEFLELRDYLYKSLISDSSIDSLYTMRMNGSDIEFVVDAEYNITPDTPAIGDVYDYKDAYRTEDPEIILAFYAPVADSEYTTDQWGTVLSGFSPIRDSHDTIVGIVGADVIATSILADQERLHAYFFIIGFLAILLASLGILYIEMRRVGDEQKVRESEERFRAVFSMVPSPIIITRLSDGVIIMCNDVVGRITGLIPDSLIGKRTSDIKIWASDHERESYLQTLTTDGEVVNRDLHWVLPDGTVRDILYSSRKMKLRNEDCLLNVGWDITDLKQAEQALRDSEEMFRNPVEQSPVGVFLYQNSVFRYVNPRLGMVLGYDPEEMIGHPINEFVVSEDHDLIREAFLLIENSPRKESICEFRGRRKDGSAIYLEVYSSLMHYRTGPALYGTIIDISDRKKYEAKIELQNIELNTAYEEAQASYEEMVAMEQERVQAYESLHKEQEALRTTQLTLQKAQAIAHLGNFEYDTYEDNAYISDEFRRILEIEDTGMRMMPDQFFERIHDPDKEKVSSLMKNLFESGTPFHTDFWIRLDDGTQRAVRAQGEVEQYEGTVKNITLIIQDITSQKTMEEQIHEAYLEKETLLREIHHRVKNNMQIISSLLSLQSKNIKDQSIQALFKETQSRVQSLALVHELLYRSNNLNKINYRIYLQKISSHLLTADRDMRDRISCIIESEDIELSIEKAIPCSLIITELITNSIKYAFPEMEKGVISITFRYDTENGEYILEYRDNGKGLPLGFDMNKASGFGSSLIMGLTKQMSGDLTIHRENQGVWFIIRFPQDE